jgi:hypothetical protein
MAVALMCQVGVKVEAAMLLRHGLSDLEQTGVSNPLTEVQSITSQRTIR